MIDHAKPAVRSLKRSTGDRQPNIVLCFGALQGPFTDAKTTPLRSLQGNGGGADHFIRLHTLLQVKI